MDNEPQHFLQAFQGAMVVTTMDYAYRVRKPDPDDPDFEDSFVMFFELIGQPYLN